MPASSLIIIALTRGFSSQRLLFPEPLTFRFVFLRLPKYKIPHHGLLFSPNEFAIGRVYQFVPSPWTCITTALTCPPHLFVASDFVKSYQGPRSLSYPDMGIAGHSLGLGMQPCTWTPCMNKKSRGRIRHLSRLLGPNALLLESHTCTAPWRQVIVRPLAG